MTTRGGYGYVGCGLSMFGNAQALYEPRFDESRPPDSSTNISVYTHTILYKIYCHSSRMQDNDDLLIEISEDAGVTWADAYANNAFVAPYNGANSIIDAQQGDSQMFTVRIHKTNAWANDQEIRIRTSGMDEHGNLATKVTPVKWA